MSKTKPFTISRDIVQMAYQRVKQNRGSAGIDDIDLEKFEEGSRNHLYRLWNRMSSGSYMPSPVLLVEIPKNGGGKRPLGIPTVTDRIAQTVVTMLLEPQLDRIFHENSYGYRPNKSAIEAVGKTRERCWRYNWVLDLDIRSFFDNIPHGLLMKALKKHTDCKWILLYVERWIKAPLQQRDGTITAREKGTPQGGIISPLLANLFLHYCMDEWLRIHYPDCPFERYADDSVIHCRTQEQAEKVKEALNARMKSCGLELHPEKTKIVYCKDVDRTHDYPNTKFDFLGYTFRGRKSKNKKGKFFCGFLPAVGDNAKKNIRLKIREWKLPGRSGSNANRLAKEINPIIQGWINYYGHFYKTELQGTLGYLNLILKKWARQKYKTLRGRKVRASDWLKRLASVEPNLFAHWRIGVRP